MNDVLGCTPPVLDAIRDAPMLVRAQRVEPIGFNGGEDPLGRDLRLHGGWRSGPKLRPQLIGRQVRRQVFGQHIAIGLSTTRVQRARSSMIPPSR